MFLDASAIVAMLGDEPDGDAFADALAADPVRLTSPIAIWESVAGLAHEYALAIPEARRKVAELVAAAEIRIVALGEAEMELALDAYDQFGKGRHPARLNLGDCFAYAAAKAHDAPLLHKDDGFWLTDARQARQPGG